MKRIIFCIMVLALLVLTACSNKDLSGKSIGVMTDDAIQKVCDEQPELCSCLNEYRNYDLCICLKDAGNDYLMQDNCWFDYTGHDRPQ